MMSNFIYGQKISKIQNVTVSPDLREFKKSSIKLYLMLSTMLLMASQSSTYKGISWRSHTTNKVLYGNLRKITNVIRERRLRFAGHIYRHDDQPVHQLLFWTPKHGKRSVGGPALTYVDVLCKDTGLSVAELRSLMVDRELWAETVRTSSS